ncbi:MAG: hypothetical protein PUA61_00105 [Succinatimonas hippei]|nr:hypothetical protein [Succinatimonas hippei]
MFNFLTSKAVAAFAAGVVVGVVGYKLVSEKKINPRALEKTVSDFAGRFKKNADAKEQNETAKKGEKA